MQKFDLENFYFWDFFSINSLIFLWIIILIYFIFKNLFEIKNILKQKNTGEINEKIDFLEILEKSKNENLEKHLEIFTLFLEEKTKNKNLQKMTFEEIKKIDLKEKEIKLFEKIYFLIYSKKDLEIKEKQKIFEELKLIFENV